jgi:hypothetical protein
MLHLSRANLLHSTLYCLYFEVGVKGKEARISILELSNWKREQMKGL